MWVRTIPTPESTTAGYRGLRQAGMPPDTENVQLEEINSDIDETRRFFTGQPTVQRAIFLSNGTTVSGCSS